MHRFQPSGILSIHSLCAMGGREAVESACLPLTAVRNDENIKMKFQKKYTGRRYFSVNDQHSPRDDGPALALECNPLHLFLPPHSCSRNLLAYHPLTIHLLMTCIKRRTDKPPKDSAVPSPESPAWLPCTHHQACTFESQWSARAAGKH